MAPSRRTFLGGVALTVGLAGCTGGPGGQADTESPTESATATETSTPTSTDAGTPAADATVVVGPDGSLVFDPETLEVEVGATVRFRWDSGGHTVTVDSQPEGANWEATGQSTESAGFTHTHTFDVAGRYDYYCVPHRGAGMVGSVVVGDDAMASDTATTMPTDSPTPTDGDDGGGGYGGDY
ncbi:plastocyanin/azurin family copper-binding protein [Halorarius halobius]|uniref:plastocyanin/azurin family copper-binding protein n=1 Tax=Halorarius halobius TaxID=2962671 RepID=UPI0020CEE0AF|nr:plastocyanin/azurin family copper-binding protein [Halorarius halobius]